MFLASLAPGGMQRERVVSSAVASVGYSAEERTLEVEFRSGRIYRYFEVPRATYGELLAAPSIGRFVNEEIRPRFDWVEVAAG